MVSDKQVDKTIGKYLPRGDSKKKARGETTYGSDMKLPGMLYGKILRSPYAHAKILRLDVTKAKKVPGVEAVVTGKDVSSYRYGNSIEDQPFLAVSKVRYVGEPVAAVAAIDERAAEEALELIEVEYSELPSVFDVEEAIKQDAPLIHEKMADYKCVLLCKPIRGTNICNHMKVLKGDVEKGFAEADFVFEDKFKTQMVQHVCMEPQVAIAMVDSLGDITLWSETQAPHDCRKMIAKTLNSPLTKVRVIVPELGGGFGAKLPLKLEPVAISLAMKARNRPVRIALTREEELACSVVRHGTVVNIKTGVKKDGTILARKVNVLWDTGAYADKGPTVCRNAGYASGGPYKIPNLRIDSYCVYTNKPVGGAMRGYGVPQGAWAYESHTDIIAHKLKMDPLKFRLKNVLQEGDLAYTGEQVRSIAVKQCLEKSAQEIGLAKKINSGNPKKRRGKGIACMWKNTASPSSSSSFVQVNADGTAVVLSSPVEMGQGWETVAAQIVAEELKIPLEKIKVVKPDTSFTPYDESTSSSRATFTGGNAIRMAAIDARQKLFKLAAENLQVSPEALEMEEEKIFDFRNPQRKLTIPEILSKGHYGKLMTVLGKGTFYSNYVKPLDPKTGQSERPTAFWMYAAQAAEVEVDVETGLVKVLKLVAAHDVGKAINRLTCEQQIEGAIPMGIGYALGEELVFDHKGRVLNSSLLDYKVSTAPDIPEMVPIIVEDAPHWMGPYGAKGLGEPALAPTAPAIANAIYNAIGVRVKELPITSEKVVRALKDHLRGKF